MAAVLLLCLQKEELYDSARPHGHTYCDTKMGHALGALQVQFHLFKNRHQEQKQQSEVMALFYE